ncbi:MAG: DnaJ domain-containing protein [Gemmatimonadota bacterium]|nr:MAG: DnaJ domain-containing protein [Gemmatimonadota bacterium]
MTFPDLYGILGVPHSADAATIRKAYLDLVRRLHPDRAGPAGTAHFQEITGAYETLSDPAKRNRYDRIYGGLKSGPHEPIFRPAPSPEPLVPEPISVLDRPEAVRPSFEELFDRLTRNFGSSRVPKSEHADGFDLGVILTQDEATVGADLTLTLPVLRECPACGGLGGTVFPCLACDQTGRIETQAGVNVRIPPFVRDGTVLEVPLERIGIRNLYLRVHVAVQRNVSIW